MNSILRYSVVLLKIIILIFLLVSVDSKEELNYFEKIAEISSIEQNGLYGWPSKIINAEGVFPYNSSNLPLIAIIDSGVDLNNPRLIKNNINQIILDENSIQSTLQHGTRVAGLIISQGDGYYSPGGALPKAKILSIQSGTDNGMSVEQLKTAILIAVNNGAKIINISQGTIETTKELEASIKYAISKGIVIVASAGNEGSSRNNYPAGYPGVIAVSTLTKYGQPGFETNIEEENIFAPGEYILTVSPSQNNDFKAWFSGSSAATTIITSLSAIIISKQPSWDSYKIKSVLLETAQRKKQ